MFSPSCTPAACKESSGLVRTCPSTVTSFRKPRWKDLWARSFKSPTLECSGSRRVSPEPLGKKRFHSKYHQHAAISRAIGATVLFKAKKLIGHDPAGDICSKSNCFSQKASCKLVLLVCHALFIFSPDYHDLFSS